MRSSEDLFVGIFWTLFSVTMIGMAITLYLAASPKDRPGFRESFSGVPKGLITVVKELPDAAKKRPEVPSR